MVKQETRMRIEIEAEDMEEAKEAEEKSRPPPVPFADIIFARIASTTLAQCNAAFTCPEVQKTARGEITSP